MDAKLMDQTEAWALEIATQATTLEDLNSVMKTLMSSALERMLNTELDVHLGRRTLGTAPSSLESGGSPDREPTSTKSGRNRRNGTSPKTLPGDQGKLPLDIPRDRDGTFEPQLIAKHQRRLPGFDEKILALDAKGMTTRDIQELLKELYGVEVSPTRISEITADLDTEVKTRRLDRVWPIVYLAGIIVHIRGESGHVGEHTMYVAIGVNLAGKKDLLGLWLAESEGAKFWLSCLTDLKNRGLEDLFLVCVDGLTGFPEASQTASPLAKVQLCIVHLVRGALKYVTDRDGREVIADLKKIYQAATVIEAEQELDNVSQKWTRNLRRSRSSGGSSGRTSSRCLNFRRRFGKRFIRRTRSSRSTV